MTPLGDKSPPNPQEEQRLSPLYLLEMHFFAELADLYEFANLADTSFEQVDTERRSAMPERVRVVDEIFAAPHQMHTHWAVLIILMIRVERCLKALGKLIASLDELPLSPNDFAGNFIEKFKRFALYAEDAGPFPAAADWEDLEGIYEIRNCIVHHQANFGSFKSAKSKQANKLSAFALKHTTPQIIDTSLEVDLSTSLKCIKLTKDFLDRVFAPIRTRDDYLHDKKTL